MFYAYGRRINRCPYAFLKVLTLFCRTAEDFAGEFAYAVDADDLDAADSLVRLGGVARYDYPFEA